MLITKNLLKLVILQFEFLNTESFAYKPDTSKNKFLLNSDENLYRENTKDFFVAFFVIGINCQVFEFREKISCAVFYEGIVYGSMTPWYFVWGQVYLQIHQNATEFFHLIIAFEIRFFQGKEPRIYIIENCNYKNCK